MTIVDSADFISRYTLRTRNRVLGIVY